MLHAHTLYYNSVLIVLTEFLQSFFMDSLLRIQNSDFILLCPYLCVHKLQTDWKWTRMMHTKLYVNRWHIVGIVSNCRNLVQGSIRYFIEKKWGSQDLSEEWGLSENEKVLPAFWMLPLDFSQVPKVMDELFPFFPHNVHIRTSGISV